jgi:hypothetical protein
MKMSETKKKIKEEIPQGDVVENIDESKKKLTLPRYMRLAKGGMWRDTEDEYSCGKTIYAFNRVMIGRDPKTLDLDPPKDKFNNENSVTYGFIDQELPWYIDLSEIPREKLGRIIIAYNAGILVRADPKNPPQETKLEIRNDWKTKKDGAVVFNGSNKEMFKKLQNLNFDQLSKFVQECPKNEYGRENLLDLFDYEKRGFNSVSRPRLEVLDLLRGKIREYGPGISSIRKNEFKEE